MNVEVNIGGIDQAIRNLGRLAHGFDNFEIAFMKIGDDFRSTERKVFNAQGAFERRSSWKPLTPLYASYKKILHPGKKILVMSGGLKRSLTIKGGYHIERISKKSMVIGTSYHIAKYHQAGTRKMVARPPVTSSTTTTRRWVRIIHKEVLKNIQRGV